MKRILLAAAAMAALPLSVFGATGPDDFVAWVRSLGGSVERSENGRITSVRLSGAWLTDADMDRLAALGALSRLDLSGTAVTDLGLERLQDLQGVKELDLGFAEFFSEAALAYLQGWQELETLNLRGTQVRSDVFERLTPLRRLRDLDLSHTRITDEGCDRLLELPRLERLAIGSNRLSGRCLIALKEAEGLKALDLGGVQRVDSGIWGLALNPENLERLGRLTQLEELYLGGATITDVGTDRPGREDAERDELPHLELLSTLRNLHTLDLSRQPVTSDGLEFLPELKNLQTLRLGQCVRLGDELSEVLTRMPQLRSLYLAGTSITDAGLKRLAALPRLERLSAGGAQISAAAVEEFRQAKPDCQTTWFEAQRFQEIRTAQ